MFKKSLKEREFPALRKTARVIPILKDEDKGCYDLKFIAKWLYNSSYFSNL